MSNVRFDARAGRKLLLVLDAFGLILILLLAEWVLDSPQTWLFKFIWVMSALTGLYLSGHYSEVSRYMGAHVARIAVGTGISMVVSYPFLSGVDVSRVLLLLTLFATTLIVLSLLIYTKLNSELMAKVHVRRILIISSSKANLTSRFEELKAQLEDYGHHVEWKSSLEEKEGEGLDFDTWDVVVYGNQNLGNSQLLSLLLEEKIKGRSVIDFVSFYSSVMGKIPLDLIDESLLLETGRSYFENKPLLRFVRVIDLLAASALFVLAILPMIMIAILIKFESSGPVIFRQERLGKNMKPFVLYKFRSMPDNAEQDGPQWATRNDKRATRVGNILRKSHLDELPQILNLLRGDISLVGPRPIRQHFADKLVQLIPFYHLRFLIKPGLTGWAQVKGPYGGDQDEQRTKHEMDLFYIQNASLPLNLYLILSTCRAMTLHAGFE